ncbi:uncharacterized protein CC84DRAFT_1261490 [Paraphaeosphaeria sporulosa]|uniref:Uncharacterized protein n=1 Tax=Paraphaeosphaeria sporulosa TaxID=1460663 RepID=A0A177C5L4_9PLEO|nr:uncharacterized protein CC84DRAFT_1261490 [Paraphaeosphaeria sporulosa]OAG02805.1 hypothetical protein CC84DRAFT_1261490 [Paraphaeosphaeria sporulosa]
MTPPSQSKASVVGSDPAGDNNSEFSLESEYNANDEQELFENFDDHNKYFYEYIHRMFKEKRNHSSAHTEATKSSSPAKSETIVKPKPSKTSDTSMAKSTFKASLSKK